MANIKIPSPSTILDSLNTAPASARGKATSPPKRAKQIDTAKPKQTKSRNGKMDTNGSAIYFRSGVNLLTLSALSRMHHLQGETTKV